jgi:predicted HicB family RNase H-like nuclease
MAELEMTLRVDKALHTTVKITAAKANVKVREFTRKALLRHVNWTNERLRQERKAA